MQPPRFLTIFFRREITEKENTGWHFKMEGHFIISSSPFSNVDFSWRQSFIQNICFSLVIQVISHTNFVFVWIFFLKSRAKKYQYKLTPWYIFCFAEYQKTIILNYFNKGFVDIMMKKISCRIGIKSGTEIIHFKRKNQNSWNIGTFQEWERQEFWAFGLVSFRKIILISLQ